MSTTERALEVRLTKKEVVVYRAGMDRVESNRHFEQTYTCGDTWVGGCWHALILDFYGFDYLVNETHQGLVSVYKFPRGIEASLLFDEAVRDHLIADEDWDTYQAEIGESWI